MSGQDRTAATALWRSLFGLPDGFFVRLRCRILGHAWWPCDPGCCNRWNCERCALMGPTLDQRDPRPREFSWPI